MSLFDREGFNLERPAAELRVDTGGAEGERLIWAFEEAQGSPAQGQICCVTSSPQPTCLLTHAEGTTPREVLESFFRRSASERFGRERYLPPSE